MSRLATPLTLLLASLGLGSQVEASTPPQCPAVAMAESAPEDKPEACSTCGVGLVAAALVGSAPLTTLSALALLAATQTGLIGRDPLASFGVPLWGCALGCAGAHLFMAVISSVAFGRDVVRLCGSFVDEAPARGPSTLPACEPPTGPLDAEVLGAGVPY